MAKADNIRQRIFGSTGPTGSISVFGSLNSGSPTYSILPEQIESLAAWLNGWDGALIDGTKPTLQDMNALFYSLTYQNAYDQQFSIPGWDDQTEYFIGSIVQDGAGTIYVSNVNNNINNALTDVNYWFNLLSTNVTTIPSGASGYNVLNSDAFIILNEDPATDTKNLYLPAPSGNQGRIITIRSTYNNIMNYFRIGVTGGGAIQTPLGSPPNWDYLYGLMGRTYICDGTIWWASQLENISV